MKKISPPGKKLSDSDGISKPIRIKRAAKALGLSTDTLSKAKQVVDSGDKELTKEMDKTGMDFDFLFVSAIMRLLQYRFSEN